MSCRQSKKQMRSYPVPGYASALAVSNVACGRPASAASPRAATTDAAWVSNPW